MVTHQQGISLKGGGKGSKSATFNDLQVPIYSKDVKTLYTWHETSGTKSLGLPKVLNKFKQQYTTQNQV